MKKIFPILLLSLALSACAAEPQATNRQLQETVDMTLVESFGVHSALMQWKRIGNEKIVHTETPSRFLYRITGSGSNLQSL